MRIQDVEGFSASLSHSPLANDPFWTLQLSEMIPLRVEAFYMRAKMTDQFDQALELIGLAQKALMANLSKLQVSDLALVAHRPPDPRFTVDDFIDAMGQLTEVRQNAILLCLESHLLPDDIVGLTWHDQDKLPISPSVQMLMRERANHRHAKLPYVFWEWEGATAQPLFSLQHDAEMAFGKNWPSIVAGFTDMVMISPRADARHVRRLLDELQAL